MTLDASAQAEETEARGDGKRANTVLGAAGATIVEADGLYQLENGALVLGRACNRF
jgi:hypothetical protein